MSDWMFYPVLLGTIVSIFGLTRIAFQNHTATSPKTLSELAAAEEVLLRQFRNILVFCGILFAITIFGFIIPRLDNAVPVIIFATLMIGGELLAAVVPARGATWSIHLLLAQTMAVGMWGLGVSFAFVLTNLTVLAAILALALTVFALLTFIDKKHYIAYELGFIFSSHLSVVVAAFSLK